MYGNSELGHHPAEQGATRLVQLLGHQARRHLADVGLQAELAQRVGRLKAQQTATDHHTRGGRAAIGGTQRIGADRVEVIERAVNMARRQVVSGHRWHDAYEPVARTSAS